MASKLEFALEKDIGDALYMQLYKQLKSAILSGAIGNNEKLPSESSLCSTLKITRVTVRKAISKLEQDGLVKVRKGSGAYACFCHKIDLSWDLENYGFESSSHLVRREISREIVSRDGIEIFKLCRTRGLQAGNNIIWLTFETSEIEYKRVPGIEHNDFNALSLYGILREDYGINPVSGNFEISAILANELVASLLDVRVSTPLVQMNEQVFDAEGNNIENSSVIYSDKAICKIKSHQM